jgi:GT2 family glycosyltransferase
MIIIVTYNSQKWLNKCLQNHQDFPIIVVDNNSSDGTPEYISKQFPEVTLIKNNANVGFAKANNQGIELALEQGAEQVFLLNHDAWIETHTLKNLIELQQQNPRHGILSPIQLNGTGKLLDWSFTSYISKASDEGRQLYSDLLLNQPMKSMYTVEFVNAAGWLISKSLINDVGLFADELFPHYGEDDNLVWRAKHKGWEIGVCPGLFMNHDRESRAGKASKLLHSLSVRELVFLKRIANVNRKQGTENYRKEKSSITKNIILYILVLKWSRAKKEVEFLVKVRKRFTDMKKYWSEFSV